MIFEEKLLNPAGDSTFSQIFLKKYWQFVTKTFCYMGNHVNPSHANELLDFQPINAWRSSSPSSSGSLTL